LILFTAKLETEKVTIHRAIKGMIANGFYMWAEEYFESDIDWDKGLLKRGEPSSTETLAELTELLYGYPVRFEIKNGDEEIDADYIYFF